MKLAYFAFPHAGGTYSVFRNLRSGLAEFGIELFWLGTGHEARKAALDPRWENEWAHGYAVGHEQDSDADTAQAIISVLEAEEFSGVLVNILGDRIQTNVMRYLPDRFLKIMVVHSITPATYAAAQAIREHVHATICVSPRVHADLTGRYGFNPHWTLMIPNGVEPKVPEDARNPEPSSKIRPIFLGRIEDQAKGVLWLPEILRRLPSDIVLTVAGDGPDMARLRKRSADLGGRLNFLGAVAPSRVGKLLSEHDIFLMPSRFEGYPVALIEAMGAGCVPVASCIKGVTDAIVAHEKDGMLFPVSDTRKAAKAIFDLSRDPRRLAMMSWRARTKARQAFSVQDMSAAYRNIIIRLAHDAPKTAAPLDIRNWSMPSGLQPSLRSYLPVPIKNVLRTAKERLLA